MQFSFCYLPVLFSFLLALYLIFATAASGSNPSPAPAPAPAPILASTQQCKYLLFQTFTYGGPAHPKQVFFPHSASTENTVRDIINRIGVKGDNRYKLGFCVGPLTFNHSDEEIHRLVQDSFRIARENNVAVAFHIDDQMFWDERKDLINNQENIEWLDWKGKLSTGRRLDWSEKPLKSPAQMCLNSPAIQAAVRQRATFIGSEIAAQLEQFKKENRENLFAGVIAGWETMIGRDFDTNRCLGFHALKNRGYSAERPPRQLGKELAQVIKDHIELWSVEIIAAGIPRDKVYSHLAFASQGFESPGLGYEEAMGFATPDVAFGKNYLPGFSTYPLGPTLEDVAVEISKHSNPPWISAEGTNVVPNGMVGESTMESYLGKMFNHNAVIVNIFSWGIGGEAEREKNLFRRATEGPEALTAYRKFLSGKQLQEVAGSSTGFSPEKFKQKIDRIQLGLPKWMERMRRPDLVEPLMHKLDALIKSSKFEEADRTADEVLRVIGK